MEIEPAASAVRFVEPCPKRRPREVARSTRRARSIQEDRSDLRKSLRGLRELRALRVAALLQRSLATIAGHEDPASPRWPPRRCARRSRPTLASEGKAWWAHVQVLADDKLEGRNAGTPGYDKAVEYVESQFKAIGLKPAGTSGFRQPVKFENRSLAADAAAARRSFATARKSRSSSARTHRSTRAASSTDRSKPGWCSSATACRFPTPGGTTWPA